MKKLDKLIEKAKERANVDDEVRTAEVFGRMSTEQLEELAYSNPSDGRIKEIFEAVGGLHLLGGG